MNTSPASDDAMPPEQGTAMTWREAIGHLAALGAVVAAAPRGVAAQPTKAPMKLTFWTL